MARACALRLLGLLTVGRASLLKSHRQRSPSWNWCRGAKYGQPSRLQTSRFTPATRALTAVEADGWTEARLRPRSCSLSYQCGKEAADERIAETDSGGLRNVKSEARYAAHDLPHPLFERGGECQGLGAHRQGTGEVVLLICVIVAVAVASGGNQDAFAECLRKLIRAFTKRQRPIFRMHHQGWSWDKCLQ